jgi:hypothetical protein
MYGTGENGDTETIWIHSVIKLSQMKNADDASQRVHPLTQYSPERFEDGVDLPMEAFYGRIVR